MHTIFQEQEKEFEEKFPDITHVSCANHSIPCGTMKNDVKSFLRLSNLAVAEAVLKMVEEEMEKNKIILIDKGRIYTAIEVIRKEINEEN